MVTSDKVKQQNAKQKKEKYTKTKIRKYMYLQEL
jgi:hypothetical protein